MDQKPPQSPENQQQQAGSPATPPAQPATPSPATPSMTAIPGTPPVSGNGSQGAGSTPPSGSPEHPLEVHPGKSKTMLYAVITLAVVIIGAVVVTIFTSNSSKPAEQPQEVEKQQVVPPTEVPTITLAPSPSGSIEEQIDSVNTTENNTDLQEADKDLQSL